MRPLLLSLGFVASGCPSPTAPGGVPQGGSFAHDPSCTLDGTLVVELGDGTSGFVPLMTGKGPVQHFGPQGGTHAFVGVRIGGLALDRYDEVLLQVALFASDQCDAPGTPCREQPYYGIGTWVLGDDPPFDPVDEQTIEQDQLVMSPGEGAVVLQAQVEDPCGQTGLAQHPFAR